GTSEPWNDFQPRDLHFQARRTSRAPELRRTRDRVTELMRVATHGTWGRVREEHEVRAFFEGFDILEPGLVNVPDWRPDSDVVARPQDEEWVEWGGVAQL
ncbi:SAM-dependent methyltransferase, partial [Streptomyces sp. NPDC052107]|uniref:SAM-dependent methyltransferase n=1 Tax=Streptomyces sp. NPDC052107 TaxID=3155632 RepID=UPI00341EB651